MDINAMGITGVAAITVICLLIGQAVKASAVDSKWIPIICGVRLHHGGGHRHRLRPGRHRRQPGHEAAQ